MTSLLRKYDAAVEDHNAGRLHQAEKAYREILAADNRFAPAWRRLGIIALQANQPSAAIECLEQSLTLEPDSIEALSNLVVAYLNNNQSSKAAERFAQIEKRTPQNSQLLNQLSALITKSAPDALSRTDLKTASETATDLILDSSTSSKTDHVHAHFHEGGRLVDAGQYARAEEEFKKALAIRDDLAELHCNLGVVQQYQRKFDGSAASFARAAQLNPNMAEAHFNLAMTFFLQEDYGRAWPKYESRWQCHNEGDRPTAALAWAPQWEGAPLKGRSILIYGEQGIGDEIMFASCLPELISSAERCVVACEPRLVPLFQRSFSADVISVRDLAHAEQLPFIKSLDYQIAIGSLPMHLRAARQDFPVMNSFLQADSAKTDAWRKRLDTPGAGLKVGISWRGGKNQIEIARRSADLVRWNPILSIPGIQFVNLQYGERKSDIDQVKNELGVTIFDSPDVDPLVDMDDFASLIATLDLVISIDNSTVHVAGSLGVPTWMIASFPSASFWRWSLDSSQNLWYESVKTFLRESGGSEDDILATMRQDLLDLRIG